MMLAKRLIDRLAAEDVRLQCEHNAACHRKKGHGGPCRSLARAVVENVGAELGKLAAWARGKR